MQIGTYIAIYLTIWWTVLFSILPLGVRSCAEAGVDPKGGDPGAPVDPKLKRKFITTTWVSGIVMVLFLLARHFHVMDLIPLPWTLHNS
jgi:predicted secreted protein